MNPPPAHLEGDSVDITLPQQSAPKSLASEFIQNSLNERLLIFAGAIFLIAIPVLVQAPLVRVLPWVSLAITPLLVAIAQRLERSPRFQRWGDLMMGFNWTWLAGSVYWGWLRWEPLVHLPVEAIGLPFAIYALMRQQGKLGNWFYLGSLFGTAITDAYFYTVRLIPFWRQVVLADLVEARSILHGALVHMQTSWGIGCAIALLGILLLVGLVPLRSQQLHWWAFSGAVLSTILVDGLFWLAAAAA